MNASDFDLWLRSFGSSSPARLSKNSMPLIMGILNVTPDSFSDAGNYYNTTKVAIDRALQMIEDGADIIDIGGESSRPGASEVSEEEELRRVIPVIERLRSKSDVCISIDTMKPRVMQEAVFAGAFLINDVAGLRSPESLAMAASLNVPVCLMHMKGNPKTMQNNLDYEVDIVEEINLFFQQKIKECLKAGIRLENLILDPGFGFGKSDHHNLRIINQIKQFQQHHLPLLIGYSRKATLGKIINKTVPQERLIAGITAAIFTALEGVSIVRTHDVEITSQALAVLSAISSESPNN